MAATANLRGVWSLPTTWVTAKAANVDTGSASGGKPKKDKTKAQAKPTK
ncbi:hypothetical protein [Streptomyces griseus]